MTDIIVAQGICSPLRPKLVATFAPYGFKGLTIDAWSQDEDGTNRRTDGDSLAPLHVAVVSVRPQAAVWAEYVICRHIAANPTVGMRLMSRPLDPRNLKWAAKWRDLPPAWRQPGCKAQPQPAQGKQPSRRPTPRPAPRGSLLDRLVELLGGK